MRIVVQDTMGNYTRFILLKVGMHCKSRAAPARCFIRRRFRTPAYWTLDCIVRRDELRIPLLVRLYHRYLGDQQPAPFMMRVTSSYRTATLARIAKQGDRESRRASIMALSLLGGYEDRLVFSNALWDTDRGVRMLADDGIREIWARAGNAEQQHCLRAIKRMNEGADFSGAARAASDLCLSAPGFAEAWNQKAIAEFFAGEVTDSIQSCSQALLINPQHYEAAVGLGHAFLEVDEPQLAIESFGQALELNPHLDAIRAYVAKVQRTL